jgi:hypothetical protein
MQISKQELKICICLDISMDIRRAIADAMAFLVVAQLK